MQLLRSHEFGDRVRDLREREGASVRDLARRAGISASTLSQVERSGSEPSIGIAERLAAVLGTDLGELLDEREATESNEQLDIGRFPSCWKQSRVSPRLTAARSEPTSRGSAPDHELAHLHPGAFKPATDGPPSRSVEPRRYSGTRAKVSEGGSRRSGSTLHGAPAARGGDQASASSGSLRSMPTPKRVEIRIGRRKRVFWSGAQALLDSLKSPAERDREWRELRGGRRGRRGRPGDRRRGEGAGRRSLQVLARLGSVELTVDRESVRVAVHEAAHCAAGLLLNRPVDSAWINGDGTAGRVSGR